MHLLFAVDYVENWGSDRMGNVDSLSSGQTTHTQLATLQDEPHWLLKEDMGQGGIKL